MNSGVILRDPETTLDIKFRVDCAGQVLPVEVQVDTSDDEPRAVVFRLVGDYPEPAQKESFVALVSGEVGNLVERLAQALIDWRMMAASAGEDS